MRINSKKWRYGSKIHVKDGRDKPWLARLNLGYDINGYAVSYILGSFDDELDCILCLKNYTENPWDIYVEKSKYDKIKKFIKLPSKVYIEPTYVNAIDINNYTFKQLYEDYKDLYFPTPEEIEHEKLTHQKARGKLSISNMYIKSRAFDLSSSLHDRVYKDLRTIDFESVLNSLSNASAKTLSRVKFLYIELDKLAEQKDIIQKGYAKYLDKIDSSALFKSKSNRIPFTAEEIKLLWNQPSSLIRDIILILLYTGERIEELLFTYNSNIHIDENYIVAGLKTANGKNRIIPIHHLIKPIVVKYYNPENEFLFMDGENRLNYPKYRRMFSDYMNLLNMKHTTHETRHTVESELNRRGVDLFYRNLIMGHKNRDVGQDVYTHTSIQELKDCIELISYKENKLIYLPANN